MQDSSVKKDCLHVHCHIVLIVCHNSFTATSTLNASREQKFFIAYIHVFTRSMCGRGRLPPLCISVLCPPLIRRWVFACFLLNLLKRSIWKRAHWKCLESGGNAWRMIEWTFRRSCSPIRIFFFSQFLWMEGWLELQRLTQLNSCQS